MTHQLIHHLYENQRPKNKPKIKKQTKDKQKSIKAKYQRFSVFTCAYSLV